MTSTEAAQILGVDTDTIEDLEGALGLEGRWTIADLERGAELLDEDEDDEDSDDDDEHEDD